VWWLRATLEFRRLGRDGPLIPVLGMGTWGLGGYNWPDYSRDKEVVEILRYGIEKGLTLIDTAEMYGAGHSEELVGEAIRGLRERVFIATKVLPDHFRYDDVLRACERSLRRLGTDSIDLYQLHWPNPRVPIRETMRALERLVDEGKVRYIGVSNFSMREMEEARAALSKHDVYANQVEYSVLERGIEEELLPYCQREGITVIAYSPLAQGRVFQGRAARVLEEVGRRHGKSIAQVALNWVISKEGVVAIPKTSKKAHLDENIGALGWRLSAEDIQILRKL
jgi:diketogulonate reductase-like aldo/keto reductase